MRAGFKEIDNGQAADCYLINTCTVTHRADSESLQFIRRAMRENPAAKIIVTGCLVELDSHKIRSICPKISIVKNRNKDRLIETTKQRNNETTARGISYFKGHTRAFLKIQDGCDNLCSYCKVPLVRGRSRSKPLEQVRREAAALAKNGYKEIVLAGICLGAYGKDLIPKQTLVDVINAIEDIQGLLRIRLSSIEARDVTDELIDKIANSKKVCPHLHIPIQSGDDEILKKMNRRYTRVYYLSLIKKIKKRIPGIAITTDVLVGFPGESQKNFKNTIDLIKKIQPLKTHIFSYSKRESTAAACMRQAEVDPGVIKKRIACLKKITDSSALNYKKRFLGKRMLVLFEGRLKNNPCLWEGLTGNYIRVLHNSPKNLANTIVAIRLAAGRL